MPSCKIQIQLFCSPHVTSNDLIQGCVTLTILRDINVKNVAIKLEGTASTVISAGPYCTHSQKYKELYQKYDLVPAQTEPHAFKRGTYQYPFEFTMPEQLPPSFSFSVSNRIDYFLKCTVSRVGLSKNYRSIMNLHHIPSAPFRNEDWSFDTKVIHVLVDPKQTVVPLKSLNLAALNRQLSQFLTLPRPRPSPPPLGSPSPSPQPESDDEKARINASQESLVASRCRVLAEAIPHAQNANRLRALPLQGPPPVEIPGPRWNIFQKWRTRKPYSLQVEAWYMSEGLVVGEPLPLKLFIYVREAMPHLELSMLRVGFDVKTEFRAESQDHKEVREVQLLRLERRVRFASSPIIDISHLVKDLRVPYDLAPSFRGHTLRRSYNLKISLRVSSSISRTTAIFRNSVKIHSNVEFEALPRYEADAQFVLPHYDSIAV